MRRIVLICVLLFFCMSASGQPQGELGRSEKRLAQDLARTGNETYGEWRDRVDRLRKECAENWEEVAELVQRRAVALADEIEALRGKPVMLSGTIRYQRDASWEIDVGLDRYCEIRFDGQAPTVGSVGARPQVRVELVAVLHTINVKGGGIIVRDPVLLEVGQADTREAQQTPIR